MGKLKLTNKLGKKIRLTLRPFNRRTFQQSGRAETDTSLAADTVSYSDLGKYLSRVKKAQIGVSGDWDLLPENRSRSMGGQYRQTADFLLYKHNRSRNRHKYEQREYERTALARDNMPRIGGEHIAGAVTEKADYKLHPVLNITNQTQGAYTGGLGDTRRILKTIKKVAPHIKIVRFISLEQPSRDIIIRRLKD